jgi:hypothetical protein
MSRGFKRSIFIQYDLMIRGVFKWEDWGIQKVFNKNGLPLKG